MVEHPDFVINDAWAAVDEIISRVLALEAAVRKSTHQAMAYVLLKIQEPSSNRTDDVELPGVSGDGMSGRNVQRKPVMPLAA